MKTIHLSGNRSRVESEIRTVTHCFTGVSSGGYWFTVRNRLIGTGAIIKSGLSYNSSLGKQNGTPS